MNSQLLGCGLAVLWLNSVHRLGKAQEPPGMNKQGTPGRPAYHLARGKANLCNDCFSRIRRKHSPNLTGLLCLPEQTCTKGNPRSVRIIATHWENKKVDKLPWKKKGYLNKNKQMKVNQQTNPNVQVLVQKKQQKI